MPKEKNWTREELLSFYVVLVRALTENFIYLQCPSFKDCANEYFQEKKKKESSGNSESTEKVKVFITGIIKP